MESNNISVKIQFNNKIHKIPSDKCVTFQDVLKSLYMIYKNKIPESFLLMNIHNAQKEGVFVHDQEVFQKLKIQCQEEKKTSIKLKLVPLTAEILQKFKNSDPKLSDQVQNSLNMITPQIKQSVIDEFNDQLLRNQEIGIQNQDVNFSDIMDSSMTSSFSCQTFSQDQQGENLRNLSEIESSFEFDNINQKNQDQLQNSKEIKNQVNNKDGYFFFKHSIVDNNQDNKKNSEIKEQVPQQLLKQLQKTENGLEGVNRDQEEILNNIKNGKPQTLNDEQKIENLNSQENEQIQEQNKSQEKNQEIKKVDKKFDCTFCEEKKNQQQQLSWNCVYCDDSKELGMENPMVKLMMEVFDYKFEGFLQNYQQSLLDSDYVDIHDRFACDLCGIKPIIGPRYNCKECPDFDFCQECYFKDNKKHGHKMEKIVYSIHNNKDGKEQRIFELNKINLKQKFYDMGSNFKKFWKKGQLEQEQPIIQIPIDEKPQQFIKQEKKDDIKSQIVEEIKKINNQHKEETKQQSQTQDQPQLKTLEESKENFKITKNENKTKESENQQQKQEIQTARIESEDNLFLNGHQSKAKFAKEPQAIIITKPFEQYQWKVELQNNGTKSWPKNVRFYCIQGIYNGVSEKVKSINSGESFEVELQLQSVKSGKQTICWRLGAVDKNGEIRYFGPKVTYELIVEKDDDVKQFEEQKSSNQIQCQEFDQNLITQNKNLLEKADNLRQIFGGNTKDYIDFIKQSQLVDENIDDLVTLYLQYKQI